MRLLHRHIHRGHSNEWNVLAFRMNMACHWEDSDVVTQEIFTNVCNRHDPPTSPQFDSLLNSQDSLICICVAFAVRTL